MVRSAARAIHPTFSFLAFRKSALIRVCQPSPVLRYAASTSASSLSFTARFGFSNGGRPRRMILSPRRISARSKNLSVSAGASSGSTHAAAPDFFFLAIIEPIVGDCRGASAKHLTGPRKIQTAMPEREIALRRIESDPHCY